MINPLDGLRAMTAQAGKLKSAQDEIRQLRQQLHDTVTQLEQARTARGLVIPQATRRGADPKVFARVILGDLHGSHAEQAAVGALFSDLEGIDVREVVLLGDMVECGGWMMQSHTLGYVAQLDEVVYEEDVASTRDFLDRLAKTCPKAKVRYLEGNHELRVERWCVDACNGNRRNAEFLMRAVAPASVLDLEKRGIPYYRQSETYDCDTPGTIKLGLSYFTHGFSTAKHAATATVGRFAGCVFYGHTHRADYAPTRMVHVGLVSAWSPGCLCKLQPRWGHNKPTEWTQGYILQIVNSEDGTFQAIPVPIHEGRSYLTTLLKTVK
jgi:predicted phosphodiesterase